MINADSLAWPDILVGPGLLGGSMILSLEQLVIDAEVFRMFKRARDGIATTENRWMEDVLHDVGPGGHFIAELSTVERLRGGEWYISKFGVHEPYEGWDAAGRPMLLEEAREKVNHILATHQPLPLSEEIERELDHIQQHADAGG